MDPSAAGTRSDVGQYGIAKCGRSVVGSVSTDVSRKGGNTSQIESGGDCGQSDPVGSVVESRSGCWGGTSATIGGAGCSGTTKTACQIYCEAATYRPWSIQNRTCPDDV